MQLLFESSEESPGEVGLSVIPGKVTKFDTSGGLKVPQIGWNGVSRVKSGVSIEKVKDSDLVSTFFVGLWACNNYILLLYS